MKKILVEDYYFKREGMEEQRYQVKDSMVDILLNRQLKLRPVELLRRTKIADKILAAEGFVELEDAEYEALKSACEAIEGFGREDVELCERILEPEKFVWC